MAKVKLNPALDAIHGKVRDLVFKTYNHNQIVAPIPDRTGIVPTPNQLAQMQQFRLAVLYGKAALADPQSKAIYEDAAGKKGQPVFALTVGDFLNQPIVDEIDLANYTGKAGETIRIRATDDVEVKGVTVTIRDQGGELLEEGVATWTTASATWNYTTTTSLAVGQSVSIEVSATDIPGHAGVRTQSRNS